MFNKGLVFKIYKELSQRNSKKLKNSIRKWVKYLNVYFTKDIQSANK